jgi:hypothetical protein
MPTLGSSVSKLQTTQLLWSLSSQKSSKKALSFSTIYRLFRRYHSRTNKRWWTPSSNLTAAVIFTKATVPHILLKISELFTPYHFPETVFILEEGLLRREYQVDVDIVRKWPTVPHRFNPSRTVSGRNEQSEKPRSMKKRSNPDPCSESPI